MRVQYRFWADVPRNVSIREYRSWRGKVFATIVLSVLGLMALAVFVVSVVAGDSDRLQEIPERSVAELATHQGERTGPVRVSGMLSARDLVTVPGKSDRKVLQGQLTVTADAHRTRGGQQGPQQELLSWQAAASDFVLTDGQAEIAVDLPERTLTLQKDRRAQAKLHSQRQDGKRIPEYVEFDGMQLPLEGDEWADWTGTNSVISIDVDLQTVDDLPSVTVVGDVMLQDGQPQLLSSVDRSLEVHFGTMEQVRGREQRMQVLLPVVAAALLFAAWKISQAASTQWHDFVIRSNE